MADNKILLDIVTPYGAVCGCEVDEVTASGSEGDFTALPGHVPFITTLRIGVLTARMDKAIKTFFVNWGYAEVGPDKVLVLADSAETAEEIDADRAREAKKRAEETLKKPGEDIDHESAKTALERAETRLALVEKSKGGKH